MEQHGNESLFEGYYVPNGTDAPTQVVEIASSSHLQSSNQESHLHHQNHFGMGYDDGLVKTEEYPLFHEYRYQPTPLNCHFQQ